MTFEEAWSICLKIPGWFSKEDAMKLWDLTSGLTDVVEIGSFLGRSATLLSCVETIESVTCIDPWIAGPKMQKCIYNKTNSDKSFFDLFSEFTSCTTNCHKIRRIQAFDYDVCESWEHKIEFIHLDHLHTEAAVFNSLVLWKRHLLPKAKVMIHDSNLIEVMNGIERSGITIEHIVKESIFEPAICSWKVYL
jgi:hypothetical protein